VKKAATVPMYAVNVIMKTPLFFLTLTSRKPDQRFVQ
jgi:hypothetical protein